MKKYKIIVAVCFTVMILVLAVNIAFYQTMVQAPIWVLAVIALIFLASSVTALYASFMYDKAKKKLQTENGTYSKKKYIIGEIWEGCLVVIAIHIVLIILDMMGIWFPYNDEILRGFLIADIAAVPTAVVTSFMKFKPDDEE